MKPCINQSFVFDLQRFGSDDKTEQPTSKKRSDAKKKGQVGRSTEMSTAFVLLVGFFIIKVLWENIYMSIASYTTYVFSHLNQPVDTENVIRIFIGIMELLARTALPIMLAIMLVGLAINLFQVGLNFSTEAIGVKLDKLNPINGFGRIFSKRSLMEMLKNNAVTMVMSLGMLCVMLVGGIDISIMSTLALSGMSIGMLLKYGHITSTLLAFIIAMAIGIACGLVVGLVISRANVPPIIATMGFMYIYRAMGYLVSHGGEWASAAALGDFKNFATSKFLGLNCVIWIIIFCYVFFFWFMKWTRTGRMIYAVGSNPSAAQVSGINVKNIKLLVYTIMGLLAGLGGALQVSIYASAMPDMQQGGEMDVIAACVIGGVSMSGGRGTVVGAFLGSIILATIAKALPLVGISSLWQNMIKGVIILVVVVINVVLQRIADKNALKRREM